MVQLMEAKEHLSQSLKRRKELANHMNDLKYVEERIEDICPKGNSNEANEAKIKAATFSNVFFILIQCLVMMK